MPTMENQIKLAISNFSAIRRTYGFLSIKQMIALDPQMNQKLSTGLMELLAVNMMERNSILLRGPQVGMDPTITLARLSQSQLMERTVGNGIHSKSTTKAPVTTVLLQTGLQTTLKGSSLLTMESRDVTSLMEQVNRQVGSKWNATRKEFGGPNTADLIALGQVKTTSAGYGPMAPLHVNNLDHLGSPCSSLGGLRSLWMRPKRK